MNKNSPDIALVPTSVAFPKPTRVRVLLHHPIHALSAIERIRTADDAHWVTARLQSTHPLCTPDVQACTGVLVDYAVQAAALRQYGKCTLVDSEFSYHYPAEGPVVHLQTKLTLLDTGILAYQCRLFTEQEASEVCCSEAFGTLRLLDPNQH